MPNQFSYDPGEKLSVRLFINAFEKDRYYSSERHMLFAFGQWHVRYSKYINFWALIHATDARTSILLDFIQRPIKWVQDALKRRFASALPAGGARFVIDNESPNHSKGSSSNITLALVLSDTWSRFVLKTLCCLPHKSLKYDSII